MRISNWKEYELIDTSKGERLERWGDYFLIRPDPQIIWDTDRDNNLWRSANARYIRSGTGGGHWQMLKGLPQVWQISYDTLKFNLKTMGFKHTGIFPEQATNWDWLRQRLQSRFTVGSDTQQIVSAPRVLNLFGYTGAASLACAEAGADVCHVDASKGMVTWARENASASGLSQKPIRWIVDDCMKFVQREARREKTYHGIIMDPPSYGRGPGGEIWKLEEQLFSLVRECLPILDKNADFFMLNSYSTGLSASVMAYVLGVVLQKKLGGTVTASEIGLPVTDSGLILPCGSTAIWSS